MTQNASKEPGDSGKTPSAAFLSDQADVAPPQVPPPARSPSLPRGKTTTPNSENEADWEDIEDFIPLPTSVANGWTPIHAPRKTRRSKRLNPLGRNPFLKSGTPPARPRSSSVEFLYERVVPTAAPPPDQKAQPEIHALMRSSRLDALRKIKQVVKIKTVKKVPKGERWKPGHDEIYAAAARASAHSGHLAEATKDSAELVIYTDGSINQHRYGGGSAVYKTGDVWAGRAIALGDMSSSCHAEMSALFSALKLARKVLQPHQLRLLIRTDSASCLNWMADGCRADDDIAPTVNAARDGQRRFAKDGIMVTFQWVKGHANIEGNIQADKLAAFASLQALEGEIMHYDVANVRPYLKEAMILRASQKALVAARQPAARREKKLRRR